MRLKQTDVFGYADKENITYVFGYTLTLQRNNSNYPIIRDNAIAVAKIDIKFVCWYTPRYIPSMESQHLVRERIIDNSLTGLHYLERSVFRKDVNTNINWTFELGNSDYSTPTHKILSFQVRKKLTHKHITTKLMINFQLVMLFVK